MARSSTAVAQPKKPGRVRQFIQVFQMTRKADPLTTLWVVLGFIGGVLIGLAVGVLIAAGNPLTIVLYTVLGVVLGLLAALIILGQLAERAAYAQIEGQSGAVGAVMRTSLRRGWRGSELPVAVNGRTHDAVYRAVGRAGVVLIAEGPRGRTQRMVDDERRKVVRVAPNVPVSVLRVGGDEGSVRLRQISRRLTRLKPQLTRSEVLAVANRLESLTGSLPVPKGVDPARMRPVRR